MIPLKTVFCIFYLSFVSVSYAAPMFVFKASIHPPDLVFQQGLTSEGENENFVQHVSGDLCLHDNDGFVSTIANRNYIEEVVMNTLAYNYEAGDVPSSVYIYTIRATNNFFSSQITLNHLVDLDPSPLGSMTYLQLARAITRRSTEYITPVQIEPSLIQEVDVYTVETDGEVIERHQNNRGYVPGDTEANSGPYLGSDSLPPQNLSIPLVSGHPPTTACLLPDEGASEHFEPFLLHILTNLYDS